jgi:hypothetical protein
VIRLYIILSLIFIGGCTALTNLIVGVSGNLVSDEVGRQVERNVSTDCKTK